MRSFLLIILICFSSTIWAGGIQITSVSNASNYDITTDTNAPIIYGGIAGACASGTESSDSTCDSCITNDLTGCNNVRIHDGLNLKITFTVTGDISGSILIMENDGTSSMASVATIPTGTYSKGESATVTIPWGSLCSALDKTNSYSCDNVSRDTEINETFWIGIDSDSDSKLTGSEYTAITVIVVNPDFLDSGAGGLDAIDCSSASPSVGICNFEAAPGDEKVIVQNLENIGGFPTKAQAIITHLRLFYSNTSFASITNSTTDYYDLKLVDNGGSIENSYVEGLINDSLYWFRMASVDKAKNVFAFTNDQAIQDACGDTPANLTDSTDDLNCPMMATPAEVFGLLTEDLNCFISTAAYGSSFHTKVTDFRQFRNQFLIPFELGRKLNSYYYKYGPYAARFISNSDSLRAISRVALFPAWAFAKASLKYGLFVAFSGLFLFLFLGFGMIHTIIKRRRQRTATV